MNILSVEIENFLSFGPTQSVILDQAGLVLIEGENKDEPLASSNGAGKSALLESIVWCLFGKTIRGLRGDDVINRKVKKNCRVVVRGVDDSGVVWESNRFRKYQGKSGFEFCVGGVDITPHGEPQYLQSEVEKHLSTNFDLFTNTVVFGQGARWRFTELSDKNQKALLDQILNIEDLSKALEYVKSELSKTVSRLDQAEVDIKISGIKLQGKQETLEAKRQTQAEMRDHALKRSKAEIVGLRADIKAVKRQIAPVAEGRMDALNEAKAKLQELREYCGVDLQRKIRSQASECARLKALGATYGSALDGVQERLTASRAKIVGTQCGECGSKLTKAAATRHIRALEVEQSAKMLEHDSVKADLDEADAEYRRLTRVEEPRAAAEIKSYEARVNKYSDEVASHLKAKDRLSELRNTLKRAKIKRADLKSEKFVDDSTLLASIDALIDDIAEAKSLVESLTGEADRYRFWVEGFGNAGIKSHLLDHVVPILNKRAQKYAQTLMEGVDVSFSAQKKLKSGELRDKFDITVSNSHGADGYLGNSGGEKRKIDIIVARTLQSLEEDRSSMTCNLSWWDEVFESLDETSCEAVMTMLREEATHRPAVFVISHLDWLKPHFTRILRVIKSGGFSRIEWG